MRYVDLGVLPSVSKEQKKKKRRKIALFAGGILALGFLVYFSYAFYWPISSLIGELIKNPQTALSFFKGGSEIKSTDGKTNILLLGIDKRANVPYTYLGPGGKREHNGFLSDTIIVASIDRETKQVSMISIPRDTWVDIPEWGNLSKSQGKINSAYSLGNIYDYPGGGLQLVEEVVSSHLGITIHYGMRIDFEGFKKTIDTLDGIDVDVEKTFDDYQYPREGSEKTPCRDGSFSCRYEHLHFEKGMQHMDGATALGYVRSRSGTNGEGSDFARARRQQRAIQAAFKKALSLDTLLDPFKLNELFRDFGETIETDFELSALPGFVKLGKQINVNSIRTFVLDPSSGVMGVGDPSRHGGAYSIVPKNNNWQIVKDKIKEFLSPPEDAKS